MGQAEQLKQLLQDFREAGLINDVANLYEDMLKELVARDFTREEAVQILIHQGAGLSTS